MVSTPAAVKEIFFAALDQATPQERATYLEAACRGDERVRREVDALLAAHDQPDSRFDQPPHVIGPSLDSTPTSDSLHPGCEIGPYKLLEQIGEGGMGLVYMAEQQRPVRRLVALKIIKPGMDSRQVIARFEAERQALALMDHPSIAKILDAGMTGEGTRARDEGLGEAAIPIALAPSPSPSSRPYFVMELVRGVPINEFCDQKRLTVRQRLELFITVCQAVQHAHQKGIIHRDLKPTNVLVTMYDAVAVPKVIDFGVAKALGQQLTEHTLHTGFAQLVGTPLYMSPEQAELNQVGVDTRSDVYSLGVMLYELLTGTTPFEKERLRSAGFDEMRRIIREEEPETVSTRLAKTRGEAQSAECAKQSTQRRKSIFRLFTPRSTFRIPQMLELDWLVAKSLEKDRNRRYDSASAFAADIQRYLADEPVQACPPGTLYRLGKTVRRHKTAFAFVSVMATLLLAIAVGGTLLSAWALRSQAQAEKNARNAEVILTFLQDQVLAVGTPNRLGKDVSLRAAVDAAEPQLSAAFADQPLVEASLRSVLGNTYRSVGEPQRAIEQHQQALALRREHLGPRDPLTLDAMDELAWDYLTSIAPGSARAGRAPQPEQDKALQLFTDTLSLRTAHLGPTHPSLARTMNGMAIVYAKMGRHKEAQTLLERLLQILRDNPTLKTVDRASIQDKLARYYRDAGELDKAQQMTLEAREYRAANPAASANAEISKVLGIANSLHDEALVYVKRGELEKAIPLLAQSYEMTKERFASGQSQNAMRPADEMAKVYAAQGDWTRAIALRREIFSTSHAAFGSKEACTILAAHYLIGTYLDAGQPAEDDSLLVEVIQACDVCITKFPRRRDSLSAIKLKVEDARRRLQAGTSASSAEAAQP